MIGPSLKTDIMAMIQRQAEQTGFESFVARSNNPAHAFAIRRCPLGIWWRLDFNLQQPEKLSNARGPGNGFTLYQLAVGTQGEAAEALMRCVKRATPFQEPRAKRRYSASYMPTMQPQEGR